MLLQSYILKLIFYSDLRILKICKVIASGTSFFLDFSYSIAITFDYVNSLLQLLTIKVVLIVFSFSF